MSPTPVFALPPRSAFTRRAVGRTAGRGAFVDWPPSLRRPPLGRHLAQDHAHHLTAQHPVTRPRRSRALSTLGPNSRGWRWLSIVRGPISNDEFTSGLAGSLPRHSIAIGDLYPITGQYRVGPKCLHPAGEASAVILGVVGILATDTPAFPIRGVCEKEAGLSCDSRPGQDGLRRALEEKIVGRPFRGTNCLKRIFWISSEPSP